MSRDPQPGALCACTSAVMAILAVFGVSLFPAWISLRGRRPTRISTVETVDHAVAACLEAGHDGWGMVTFAQRTVYEKFIHYSCRNLWDTPGSAFRYGMGYCTQYNLALKQILDRLGFETQAVFALRVHVAENPDWTMGHTRLRVTIAGEMRDVCAGNIGNAPGAVHFTPVTAVLPGYAPVLILSHLGMILFCGFLEWRSFLLRQPLPGWLYIKR